MASIPFFSRLNGLLYRREFARLTPRALILTLVFGSLAGAVSGWFRKKGTQLI